MVGQHPQEPGRRGAPALRQERDDRAELRDQRRARADEIGRHAHEVVFVVPLALEQRLRRAVQAHDFARPLLGPRGQHVELGGVEVGELAVRGDECFLGRRMLRDRCEQPGRTGERAPHRRRDDRSGDGTPAGGRELTRGEELGQPVDGEEGDTDDTAPARAHRSERTRCEPAPRRHAHRVRRHHNRDRREDIGALRTRDRVAQCLRSGAPVRGRDDGDRHGRIVRRA